MGDAEPKKGKRQKKKQADDAGDVRMAPDALPDRLQQHHKYVTCGADTNLHASTVTGAHAYMALDVDNSWSFDHFARNFSVSVNSSSKDELEFDIKGIDPAIVNAIRRIMIAEVPTVAIEHVFFIDNTSIVPDEMLAHRLGLVPLDMDPRLLETRTADSVATERNTVVFKLHITCRRQRQRDGGGGDEEAELVNDKVLAQHLEYLPNGSEIPEETNCNFGGSQLEALSLPAEGVAPVIPDILLAKMRPGQTIELEAHCTKGIGAEHAKWSPVATAWYRLQPEVVLLKEVTGEQAQQLLDLCPSKPDEDPLFRLDDDGKLAVVKTRGNEHHLEKLRRLTGEPEWEDILRIQKHKEHFIFTIQSTGALPPDVLFEESLDVLSAKCDALLENL